MHIKGLLLHVHLWLDSRTLSPPVRAAFPPFGIRT